MSLVILTKSPVFNFKDFIRHIKSFIKFLLGQKRGPDAVVASLVKGLKELNVDYKLNPKKKQIKDGDIVYINGSIKALEWAIEAKKEGKIKKIIVGPSICVIPDKSCPIIFDENIDIIIQPSDWVRNFWVDMAPQLANKIVVWAAGVDVPDINAERNLKYCLVYQKNADNKLLDEVVKCLKDRNLIPYVIHYGRYRHSDFMNILAESKLMIYLSNSESQGIAPQEAWSVNVPTLVWNRGFWQYGNIIWKDEKISAPYLSDKTGMFFKDINDFKEKISIFINQLPFFSPRKYVSDNLSNRIAAEKFLKLAREI